MKFKRMPFTSAAIETYLVRHKGRAIRIYQMPIPGFWGSISEEVKQLAAEKAYRHGWRKIVLTWGDMLSSCCFDEGYCWLLAMNVAMAQSKYSHYNTEHFLCEMDRGGSIFEREPRNRQEDEENAGWARAFENDGWDMEMAA